MLSAVGLLPRALFARGRGPPLLFMQPPSLQTAFLIFRPAWAIIERGCIIQRGPERKREKGGLVRKERRGIKREGEIQAPEIPVKDSADWGGG